MTDGILPDRIDTILNEAIRRIRGGELFEIESYYRHYPELADELQILLPAVLLLERPIAQPHKTTTPLPVLAGYKILREIGRGAMGVVYEAIQEQLDRRVALKVIRVTAGDAAQIARFCREANTTARLHHPNIVPVFGSGDSDGLAFYSMQLIQGSTLQQILMGSKFDNADKYAHIETRKTQDSTKDQQLRKAVYPLTDSTIMDSIQIPSSPAHRKQSNTTSRTGFDLTSTSAAELILQVAEALAYAHGQGVLHRDIKPSNIMVDDLGRAWITDFGLAWHADAQGLTANGDIVGTVRYMAPEGFNGKSSEQSDVYSLGLTLYELIQGQPAFSQSDRAQLIREILEGQTPQFTVEVPIDLATICAKCLQRNTYDRYQSAALLATDLKNFLAGRPINARHLSPIQKAYRWCSRNRLVTALTAVLVLVGTCAAVANYWSSRDVQRLRAESTGGFELAQTNLRMLLKTVDRFCQTVSEDRRLYSPEFRELRNLLLESASELNGQFRGNPAVPKDATLQLAGVFRRLGGLRSTADTLIDSEAFLIKARNLLLDLPTSEQKTPEVAMELLDCYQELGWIYWRMNQPELSRTNLQDSIRIANDILAITDKEDDAEFSARLKKARSLSVLGSLYCDLRQFEQSEAAMSESVQLIESIVLAKPDEPDVMFELAKQWTRLGTMRTANLRNWRQAEEPFREAARLYEILRQADPSRPDVEYNAAFMLERSAKWLYMSGQLPKAIETQRQATDIFQNLTDRFGYDLAFQLEYGIALRQLADFLKVTNKLDPEITRALERSEAVLTKVVESDNSDIVRVMALANTCQVHAESLQIQNLPKEALVKIDRSVSTFNLILDKDPKNVLARESRYYAALTRADLLTELQQYREALAEWDVAIELSPKAFVDLTAMQRTRTQALSRDITQATQRADEILSRQSMDNKASKRIVFAAARTFAIAARVGGFNSGTGNLDAPGNDYARRAVELLKVYSGTGTAPNDAILSCDDLHCLRNRDDFRTLLEPTTGPAQ